VTPKKKVQGSLRARWRRSIGRFLLVPFAAWVCSSAAVAADEIPKEWLAPQPAVRLLGNTYYVGTYGLSSILITSDEGHVLIDAGLDESADLIADNIRSLGFKLEDVKTIVFSHAHYDHVGGVAELQRMTGAEVVASRWAAQALRRGRGGEDDPQFALGQAFPAVEEVRTIRDGETLQVGLIALTGHSTPGHTPGGMSWSWYSCERLRCGYFVYADSLTAVSADGFRFSDSTRYPRAVRDFQWSFYIVRNLRCDILLTPNPESSNLWGRLAQRNAGKQDALMDSNACRAYSNQARQAFDARLAQEREIKGE
jgi:metallo-beta-lactamase class B